LNAEARALIDRAHEELDTANQLLEGELYSQAVSGAYRAMSHTSEALMESAGLEYSSEVAMRAAFGQLLLKFGGVDPRFHGYIFTAFRQRQAADWRPPTEVSAERARELLSQAREYVEMTEAYLGEQGGAAEGPP
jgi:uncharacterized protein (UPF0332 family)